MTVFNRHINVLIVDGNTEYSSMFASKGWKVVSDIKDADLVQFTGGSDVYPPMYNCAVHPKTKFNSARDHREKILYEKALGLGIPMAGICRGGQFLNVMNGGTMWQDVNNHTMSHDVIDNITGDVFKATSTHHQMMKPHQTGKTILSALVCTRREFVDRSGAIHVIHRDDMEDIEAVLYEETGCFCFQPHPEFYGQKELSDRYIEYLKEYIL